MRTSPGRCRERQVQLIAEWGNYVCDPNPVTRYKIAVMKKLNSAQRLWLVFAIAMFVSALGATYMGWPARDAAIVTDLLAPECEIWRRTDPNEARENRYHPEYASECRALRAFIEHEGVTLQSEAEYENYRLRDGLRKAMTFLAWWAVLMGALYVFGWTSGRLVRALLNRNRPKPR
jgi:hypothetical protein